MKKAAEYTVLKLVGGIDEDACSECVLGEYNPAICYASDCDGVCYEVAENMTAISTAEYTGLNKAIDELTIQRSAAYDEIAALKEQNKALADDHYSLIEELKVLLPKTRNTQEG